MKEQKGTIITKYLSGEASKEEKEYLFSEINKNKKFKQEFEEFKQIWNSLEKKDADFNKDRIEKLIAHKIYIHKKQRKNKILYATLKYAAVFIGLLVISVTIFNDLNRTETIANNTNSIKKIVLPDNTIVTLNKNAEIEYENSSIKGFNRKVKLNGEAFFEVTKKENQKFVVKTGAYNITVLGTKFNVRTYKNENSVVLSEGKILLNNFKKTDNRIVMKPGEIVRFNPETNSYILKKINPEIYTSWMKHRLEFDNFSLLELGELLKVRYNKTLIINNENARDKCISGSAPADDVHLIVKALQSIFKSEITEKNDTIIIN